MGAEAVPSPMVRDETPVLSFTSFCFCNRNLKNLHGEVQTWLFSAPPPNIQEVPWAYCSELHSCPWTREKVLLIHLLPHTPLTALRESPAFALRALFSSSLGCQRGERSPKESSACLMTMDDILTDKVLCSGLHLVFQLLFMKLMKTAVHAASRQVL